VHLVAGPRWSPIVPHSAHPRNPIDFHGPSASCKSAHSFIGVPQPKVQSNPRNQSAIPLHA
jgi:hypothetical protein